MPRPVLSRLLPTRLALALALALPLPAVAEISGDLAALQQQDRRLAFLAETMLVANRALCRQLMPITGIIIHSRDQFGAAAPPEFEQAPVAIAGVVPGSAAQTAGLRAGDGLAKVGGRSLTELPLPAEGPLRDAVFAHFASLPPDAPLDLLVMRDGAALELTIEPQAGCRALVEVLADDARIARSDGRVIQLSVGLARGLSDEGLSASFAHELAHLVLEHRRRLSEAGVSKGFFAEFGSNRRRNRQAEKEADRLSVHLLANAGLDPAIGPRFWRSEEARAVDAGIFRSAIYQAPSQRATLMEQEIADHLAARSGLSWPAHLLAMRDTAF